MMGMPQRRGHACMPPRTSEFWNVFSRARNLFANPVDDEYHDRDAGTKDRNEIRNRTGPPSFWLVRAGNRRKVPVPTAAPIAAGMKTV